MLLTSTAVGSLRVTDCITCGAGKYVEVMGSDEESDCILCDAGKFSTVIGSGAGAPAGVPSQNVLSSDAACMLAMIGVAGPPPPPPKSAAPTLPQQQDGGGQIHC